MALSAFVASEQQASVDDGRAQHGQRWQRARLRRRGAPLNDALAVPLVLLLRAERATAADLHLNLLQSATKFS